MVEDLQYKIVQDLKRRKNDPIFEARIAAFNFPLVVNGDWNPYIFEAMKCTKEEFLAIPQDKKLIKLISCFVTKRPIEENYAYTARLKKYAIELCNFIIDSKMNP